MAKPFILKSLKESWTRLNEALFLQQLNFRLRTPSHVVDGVAWYEASYASLAAVDFPFWSEKTIARTARRLEKRGIITARPMSRNTYDRTKWYTINDEKLAEVLGSTSGQSVPLEGTAGPHHDEDNVSPSFKEEIREKKEPEGAHMCRGEEEEDQLATDPQATAAETAPEVTALQAEKHITGIPVSSHAPEQPAAATHQRAELKAPSHHAPGKPGASDQTVPTAKQLACPHPSYHIASPYAGFSYCRHCYWQVEDGREAAPSGTPHAA